MSVRGFFGGWGGGGMFVLIVVGLMVVWIICLGGCGEKRVGRDGYELGRWSLSYLWRYMNGWCCLWWGRWLLVLHVGFNSTLSQWQHSTTRNLGIQDYNSYGSYNQWEVSGWQAAHVACHSPTQVGYWSKPISSWKKLKIIDTNVSLWMKKYDDFDSPFALGWAIDYVQCR